MTVTIIGTTAFDTIQTPFGKKSKILGGSASYAGTAASIFSNNVGLIGIVGQDFPDKYLAYYQSKGMNIDGIEIAKGKTFHWDGEYTGDMNQAITNATDLNVLLAFDPQIPGSLNASDIVFLANIDPVLQKKALDQFVSPRLTVLDTMNFWIESQFEQLKKVLSSIDVLIINDQEIRQLTGKTNLIQAMRSSLSLGPKRVVCKKGEHGAIMFNGRDFFMCPAFPLEKVLDPTGAGDSFAGGFCGYLDTIATTYSESDYKKAIIYGTLVSSNTVQGFGLDAIDKIDFQTITKQYDIFQGYLAF